MKGQSIGNGQPAGQPTTQLIDPRELIRAWWWELV
jgi:hypothetical protein